MTKLPRRPESLLSLTPPPLPPAGEVADWLRPLPRLTGDQLLERERSVMKMQTLVLKECLRESTTPYTHTLKFVFPS